MNRSSKTHQRIYETVSRIPAGKVMSYGQVAAVAGLPGQARLVGYALHNLPDDSPVPWHRVLNARGKISLDMHYGPGALQRSLLENEGVEVGEDGSVIMDIYQVGTLGHE